MGLSDSDAEKRRIMMGEINGAIAEVENAERRVCEAEKRVAKTLNEAKSELGVASVPARWPAGEVSVKMAAAVKRCSCGSQGFTREASVDVLREVMHAWARDAACSRAWREVIVRARMTRAIYAAGLASDIDSRLSRRYEGPFAPNAPGGDA